MGFPKKLYNPFIYGENFCSGVRWDSQVININSSDTSQLSDLLISGKFFFILD